MILSLTHSDSIQIVGRGSSPSGDPDVIRVLFSDSSTCVLTVADWVDLGLRVGKEVPHSLKQEIDARSRCVEAERIAVSYLTGRVKTAAQVRQYLQRRELEADVIDTVIRRLEARGMIDDALYAAWYVEREGQRLGRAQLIQRLKHRGIAPDVAQFAVRDHLAPDVELDTALRLAQKYLRRRGWFKTSADRLKFMAYLYGKGVSSELAGRVLRSLERTREDSSTTDS